MADNISVTEGSGKTVATDDVSGIQYQVVKLDVGGNGASSPVTDLATSAKQPALGTAGTASADVITIQGKSGMTKVLTTPDLPSGAATSAKQPALGSAGSASTDVITIQGIASGTVVPVSSASLPLPSGASTSANQITANTSLSSIDGKTPALGQTTKSGSVPITMASDPDIRPASGNITVVDSGTTTTVGFNNVNVYTGTATASSYVQQALNGASAFRASVSGTFVGTIQFEISVDGGTSWTTTGPIGSGTVYRVGSVTNIGHFYGDCAGATHVRARSIAFSSGPITIQFAITASPGIVKIDSPTSLADNTTGAQNTIQAASTGAPAATTTAIVTNLREGLPASSAKIGVVTTDQTTHGTTDLVAGDITKVAGSAISQGHGTAATAIRVELPTDGTGTVGLIAGSALVGKVGVDQTTPGTTNAISIAQVGSTTVVTGGVNGSQSVGGPTASGSSIAANPVTIGGQGKTSLPTAVSDGQVVNATLDKFGRQIVLPYGFRDLFGSQTTTITSSTSETTIVTAAASTFNDLTALIAINTSATATRIDFRNTTAGSVIFALYVPAGETRGIAWNAPAPQASVNTNWTATCGTSVSDVRIVAWSVQDK